MFGEYVRNTYLCITIRTKIKLLIYKFRGYEEDYDGPDGFDSVHQR